MMNDDDPSHGNVERTAFHEAGHVLVAIRWLGVVPREVSVYAPTEGRLGHAAVAVASLQRAGLTDAQCRRVRVPEAAMFLGGLAAEEVAGFGRSTGIADLEALAQGYDRPTLNDAMTARLPPVVEATDDVEGALSALVDAFPSKRDPFGRLLRVYGFAMKFLGHVKPALERLSAELLARSSLSASDIERVLGADLRTRRRAC